MLADVFKEDDRFFDQTDDDHDHDDDDDDDDTDDETRLHEVDINEIDITYITFPILNEIAVKYSHVTHRHLQRGLPLNHPIVGTYHSSSGTVKLTYVSSNQLWSGFPVLNLFFESRVD